MRSLNECDCISVQNTLESLLKSIKIRNGFYKEFSINKSVRLSYQIRNLSNNSIDFLFEIYLIIINNFQMRMP
jgi:hypothetical protein